MQRPRPRRTPTTWMRRCATTRPGGGILVPVWADRPPIRRAHPRKTESFGGAIAEVVMKELKGTTGRRIVRGILGGLFKRPLTAGSLTVLGLDGGHGTERKPIHASRQQNRRRYCSGRAPLGDTDDPQGGAVSLAG